MFEKDFFSFKKIFGYQQGAWEKATEGMTTSQVSFEEPSISIEALYQSSSLPGLDVPVAHGTCAFGSVVTDGSPNDLEDTNLLRFPMHIAANRAMLHDVKWWQKSKAKCIIEGCLPDVLSLDRALLFPAAAQGDVGQVIRAFPLSQSLLKDVLVKYGDELGASGSCCFVVTGCPIHEGGAGPVMQMAFVLAQAVFILKALEKHGVEGAKHFDLLRPEITTSSHIFMSLCTLRALRFLWSHVGRKLGLSTPTIKHHALAVTSARMLTKKTPWNNLTRCTYATLGAFLGGASEVFLTPFVAPLGTPSRSGIRLMRNLHALIRYEAGIVSVNDPGKGSFFVEHLTKQLVTKAWSLFQRIEEYGGLPSALSFVQDYIEKEKEKRKNHFSSKEKNVLGVSLFPGEKKDDGDIKQYFTSALYPEAFWIRHLPWDICRDEELCAHENPNKRERA